MAESDSILQLGIEAARDGNREEARNLFRLLTRQDSKNAQAWLWLAGVAENREERQAALERVVELEPTNEMAVKGLQALGVRPTVRLNNDPAPATTPVVPVDPISSEPEPVAAPVGPTPEEQAAANRARFDVDDDDPFARPRLEVGTAVRDDRLRRHDAREARDLADRDDRVIAQEVVDRTVHAHVQVVARRVPQAVVVEADQVGICWIAITIHRVLQVL